MTCSTPSRIHTARIMLAVLLLTGTAGLPVHAATLDKPVTVTKPGQTVSDDFNVENCTAPAVVGIAASAAKSGDDVTKVDTKSIVATFSNPDKADGIRVSPDYPGTVKLADGLHITVDSDGYNYDTTGIYLNGVNRNSDPKGSHDESVNANAEYKKNGKISDTIVEVGNATSITVNAGLAENRERKRAFAVGLENHFGHMKVGNDVTLSAASGKFNQGKNSTFGFYQLFYGDTSFGDRLTSTAKSTADKDTKSLHVAAIESVHDHPNDTQIPAIGQNQLTFGNDAHLYSTVTMSTKGAPDQEIWSWGAFLSHTDFTIGNGLTLDAEQIGQDEISDTAQTPPKSYIIGFSAENGSKGTIGEYMQDRVMVQNRMLGNVRGVFVNTSTLKAGKNLSVSVNIKDSQIPATKIGGTAYGIWAAESTVTLGERSSSECLLQNSRAKRVYGIETDDSQVDLGAESRNLVSLQNSSLDDGVYGVDAVNGSSVILGDGSRNEITLQNSSIPYVEGLFADQGDVESKITKISLGDNSQSSILIQDSQVTGAYGADIWDGAQLIIGKNGTVSVAQKGDADTDIAGIFIHPDSQLEAGDGLHVTAAFAGKNKDGKIYGICNDKGKITLGKNTAITVTAPDEREKDTIALYSFDEGKTELGDGAVLTVDSKAKNSEGKVFNNVVKADSAGTITFDGGMTLMGSQNAIYSTDEGSSVSALGDGRKVILGDLEAANKGSIQLNLNTADSLFRGKSTIDPATHGLMAVSAADTSDDSAFSVDTTSADTELTLANGARWDMTGSSQVTGLTLDNGGTVNMQYSPSYQRLDVNQYSGQNGIFQMKTDLASQTDGDKVYMNGAEKGSHGLVRVHDQSFLTGNKVTDTKHLLLITDNSKNATFSGQSIDEGGLWDVTPTIQNGSYVRNTMGVADARDTEWYLTKLTKSVNTDTKPLLGAVDYSYGLYRNSIDTLRQRMGDLRFLKNKRDAAGIWARTYGGNIDGPHYDSKYHTIQVGYDYAANDKSIYGFLGERGIASPHYDYGSSKDHSLAGAIYGTWFGDSGSYTDVVAKWGRDDSNLHTYGPYADNANFRTDSESLSVEYGRTLKLNRHGLFIEPQAQLVAGRLNDKDFTTGRGKKVHMDSYDSCIGRLGFVFGQRRPDASRPYDYYLKASVLHEFGGDRSFHLSAPDGETMDLSSHYGSTWYEAGFGGTYRANDSTYLYADAERSFGSNWHKKWQINIGINWQF